MAEIRLSGINKIYPDGTHAVHDVDLHIADGEFMIMVGPSGCAKSTILRMVAGLEVPTSGTVEIGGRVVNEVAPKDRDIAMVFQSYALYPHMTVRENMAFGLRLRKMPPTEIDQRVAEAARVLGLEHLLDRLPKAMSGGQRQRVAMGRAIVREPQAFLMDEPLSNLDAKLRVQMRTEIAKLHQRLGVTTMYVTHDQVEALTLGQRICILRKGVVQQVDTPFQVYTNPANVFVGGFIGSPGMNFMNGHLVLHDGLLYLRLGEHHLPVPASVTSRLLASTDIHGRGVIVGVRPEHMAMSSHDDPSAIPVQVELTEAMGAEVYAYYTASVTTPDLAALSDTQATSETFVARLGAGADAHAGSQIWLRPDLDEVHLFDPQSMLTMLSPAEEAEVRARQAGTAIEIANTMHGVQSPVSAPPATALVTAPVQPVIHLHQTFVRPDTAAADPAAIASVFDQPVASPVALEPLVPAAAATGSPNVGPAQAGENAIVPRPSFASGIAGGTPLEPAPAPAAASGPPPSAVAPRGFAPRYIGVQDAGGEPPTATVGAVSEPAAFDAAPHELDDAIGAMQGQPDGARAPSARDTQPSAFRETLARIRQERIAATAPATRRLATQLQAPLTLSPPPDPARSTAPGDSAEPSPFRLPRLGGMPKVP